MCLQTIAMILGQKNAPWEDPATAKELLRPLGIFKAHVLDLIARNPAQRSSILHFKQSCLRNFSDPSFT